MAKYLNIPNTLTNVFEVDDDGLLTGEVVKPILWGPGKANAVQKFASERGIDLADSYFYADGDEDVALMYLVGNPRPTNPEGKMATVAKQRGWPILKFNSRSGSGLSGLVRNVAGEWLIDRGSEGASEGVGDVRAGHVAPAKVLFGLEDDLLALVEGEARGGQFVNEGCGFACLNVGDGTAGQPRAKCAVDFSPLVFILRSVVSVCALGAGTEIDLDDWDAELAKAINDAASDAA